jgi:hypothetical protein
MGVQPHGESLIGLDLPLIGPLYCTEEAAGALMVIHSGEPVVAGLRQFAQMDRGERARVVRLVCTRYPALRSLLVRVRVARGVAFASCLDLAVAIVLVTGGVPAVWVSILVLGGLVGFGSVTLVLTDSRFDLLLAVLGAHRTDELRERLVTEQLYGDGPPRDAVATGRPEDRSSPITCRREPDHTCCGPHRAGP